MKESEYDIYTSNSIIVDIRNKAPNLPDEFLIRNTYNLYQK